MSLLPVNSVTTWGPGFNRSDFGRDTHPKSNREKRWKGSKQNRSQGWGRGWWDESEFPMKVRGRGPILWGTRKGQPEVWRTLPLPWECHRLPLWMKGTEDREKEWVGQEAALPSAGVGGWRWTARVLSWRKWCEGKHCFKPKAGQRANVCCRKMGCEFWRVLVFFFFFLFFVVIVVVATTVVVVVFLRQDGACLCWLADRIWSSQAERGFSL